MEHDNAVLQCSTTTMHYCQWYCTVAVVNAFNRWSTAYKRYYTSNCVVVVYFCYAGACTANSFVAYTVQTTERPIRNSEVSQLRMRLAYKRVIKTYFWTFLCAL